MNSLEETKVLVNDKLVSFKKKVSFVDRLSTATIESRLVTQGTGEGNFRAVVIAEKLFWMSNETFKNMDEALEVAKEVAKNHLPEILFTLRVPAKTAERMKFVWISDKDLL